VEGFFFVIHYNKEIDGKALPEDLFFGIMEGYNFSGFPD